MSSIDILLWFLLINWGGCLVVSWAYVLWLWLVSKDVKIEGWVIWRRMVPIARFRLVSTKSWYAKAWQNWYGFALLFAMIHRDEKGMKDDKGVEEVIVHETHHVVSQILPLGMMFWVLYLAHSMYLATMTTRHPYQNNIFEVAAYRAARVWVNNGRPKILNFGPRQ